jgi:hypothetical protein
MPSQHHSGSTHFIPIPETPDPKRHKLFTSLHMSVLFSIMLGLLSTMASFTDFIKFYNQSR